MNKKLNVHHPSIILNAIYNMWIGRSIYFVKKKRIYPTILCIFIYSDRLLSIFNMFVMDFIRGAEREEISES